VKISIRLTKEQ